MKKSIIYSLLFCTLLAGSGVSLSSCSSGKSGNSAVDRRKKAMGKRKMKKKSLGCPMKDC